MAGIEVVKEVKKPKAGEGSVQFKNGKLKMPYKENGKMSLCRQGMHT